MLRNARNKGLGLAGLSLVAALMMSGSAYAQEAGGGADTGLPAGEDGVAVDDGWIVADPICLACLGDGSDGGDGVGGGDGSDGGWVDGGTDDGGDVGIGDGTDGTDGAGDGGWVDDGGIFVDVETGGDPCADATDCAGPPEPLEDDGAYNPEIYYMSGSGGIDPEVTHRGNGAAASDRSGHRAQVGKDLCLTPAAEVVWLCELVNGKSE